MFGVRFHGRGGQGVVTAAELLAVAAFDEGAHAQAFPFFGSERTGAPVVAFCRLDDWPIRTHEPVAEPDAVVIQDAGLLRHVDVLAGLRPDGYVLVNSARPAGELALPRVRPERLRVVDATGIALRHLGRAVPNAALLGAFAALTHRVGLAALADAIGERFGARVAQDNIAAATEAYRLLATGADPGGADLGEAGAGGQSLIGAGERGA